MNEQLPYEQEIIQKLEALSLPDENAAWINMRRRLDKEEDDDGIIIPPLKGCGLFAIIAIGLLLIGSLLFHNKIFNHQSISGRNYSDKQIEKQKPLIKNSGSNVIITDSSIKNNNSVKAGKNKNATNIDTLKTNHNQQAVETKIVSSKQNQHLHAVKRNNVADNKINVEEEKRKSIQDKHAAKINIDTSANNQNSFKHTDSVNAINYVKDSINQQTDTASKKIIAQTNQDSSNNNKKKKDEPLNKHKVSFGAGLTVHQQLPVAGQTFVPYNAEGRKGSLLDYIPSLFFRTYYKQKFFLQVDFRYGAPQLIKQFIYSSQTKFDTGNAIITTSYSLKKTYYHQLPISIHYNIIPQLSIGTGIIINKFNSAVVQQDINIRNDVGNDTTTISKILNIKKADSTFSKTYMQAMFEADYKWKRFSLGMMYAKGLQPFIKLRSPAGDSAQQNNSSLQIFLRYELWRSKKK